MQDLTRRLASCCEAIGTADESKRVSDIFSGGDNQGDATDSLFVGILRAGCETAGLSASSAVLREPSASSIKYKV